MMAVAGMALKPSWDIKNIRYYIDPDSKQAILSAMEAEGNVNIPSTVTDMGVTYTVIGIADSCFYENDKITSVTIPETVTSIGDFAFAECRQLRSVNIPSAMTKIGSYCFSDCVKLTSITIPASVISIGFGCLNTCRALENIQVAKDNPRYASEGNMLFSKDYATLIACPNAKGNFIVPSTVKTLSRLCFAGCVHLMSITIPQSVIRLDASCFNTCPSLRDINIDGKNKIYAAENGMVMDKKKTMLVAYPSASGTVNNIPNTVKSFEKRCFEGCELKGIIVPPSVAAIKDFCFEGCDSLSSVVLPASVLAMGYYCFYDCNALTEITCEAEVPPMVKKNFEAFDPKACKLIVPEHVRDKYKAAVAWKEFADIKGK